MQIKSIKTKDDYRAAMARIEQLLDAEPNTPESDELDELVTLVEDFEKVNYPIDLPTPAEAIKFRMEQKGIDHI